MKICMHGRVERTGWVRTHEGGSTNRHADLNAARGGPQGEGFGPSNPTSSVSSDAKASLR